MKKSQASQEFLLIIGFVLITLIPISLFAFQTYADAQDSLRTKYANDALQTILQESQTVYYLGPPSRSTFEIYIPERAQAVTFADKDILIKIKIQGGIDTLNIPNDLNISGSIPITQGIHQITAEATNTGVIIS
jgi:uncharacterized protein (UPF0333 family)